MAVNDSPTLVDVYNRMRQVQLSLVDLLTRPAQVDLDEVLQALASISLQLGDLENLIGTGGNSGGSVDLSGVNSALAAIQATLSSGITATVDLSGVNTALAAIQARVNQIPTSYVNLSGVYAALDVLQASVNQIPTSYVNLSGVNSALAAIRGTDLPAISAQIAAVQASTGVDFSPITAALTRIEAKVDQQRRQTLNQLTYTPTDGQTQSYFFSQPLSQVNDGNTSSSGSISGPAPWKVQVTFPRASLVNQLRIWTGQYNGFFNYPTRLRIWSGTSDSGSPIATFSLSSSQSANTLSTVDLIAFDSSYSQLFLVFDQGNTSTYTAVLEIQFFGMVTGS